MNIYGLRPTIVGIGQGRSGLGLLVSNHLTGKLKNADWPKPANFFKLSGSRLQAVTLAHIVIV